MLKYDLPWSLVSWKFFTELVDLFLCTGHAILYLYDGRCDLSETGICNTDDCNVLDLLVFAEEVLYLYRVDILSTTDYNIFLSIYKINKSIFVLHSHISCVQPAVLQALLCRLWILIVACHDSRTLEDKLADCALLDLCSVLVHDLCLPAVARHTDSSDLMYVLYSQMYSAWSDGL